MKASRFTAALAALLLPLAALATDTATLSWTTASQYVDGTALAAADIAATDLSCTAVIIGGVRSACSLVPVRVPMPATSYVWSFTFTAAAGGTICFAAQTELLNGATSDPTPEACKTIAAKKANAPATLRVQ
jgi:hypothetical protein